MNPCKLITSCLFLALLHTTDFVRVAAAAEEQPQLTRAVVAKEWVYTTTVEKNKRGVEAHNLHWISIANLNPGNQNDRLESEHQATMKPGHLLLGKPIPSCWTVAYDQFWSGGTSAIVETKFQLLSRYRLDDFRKGNLEEAEGPYIDPLNGFSYDGGPFSDTRILAMFAEFRPLQHYNYLPISEGAVRLFLMANVRGSFKPADKSDNLQGVRVSFEDDETKNPKWWFGTWHYERKWSAEKKHWEEGKWTHEEWLKPAFTEPFQVFGKGDDYWFVTETGKAYLAAKPADGPRVVKPLWTDDKQPIIAIVQDDDGQRTFAFCKSEKPDQGTYFELTKELQQRRYDLSTVKRKVQGPLEQPLRYVQLLIGDGYLKMR